MMDVTHHLYVHLPFCPSICPYCSFHVLPVNKSHFQKLRDGLFVEHQKIVQCLELATVYLGGGTPTALPSDMLESLLKVLLVKCSGEVTIECNPSTLSMQKAKTLQSCGVNRLSIGGQSFDREALKTLGRSHSAQAIQDCVMTAREAGFNNINLDLIFGVPGQSLNSWRDTLEIALSLQTQHISCYGLTYEEDTEFFLLRQRGRLRENPDLEIEMFRLADELLSQAGFIHYEISNYALSGFESRHNLAYWQGKDYHGIGPSAVSTVKGIRRRNGKFSILDGQWNVEEEEILSTQVLAAERMALGLRTQEGVNQHEFEEKFGFNPQEYWGKEIQFLTKTGLLLIAPRLKLTPRGQEMADEVATYFV